MFICARHANHINSAAPSVEALPVPGFRGYSRAARFSTRAAPAVGSTVVCDLNTVVVRPLKSPPRGTKHNSPASHKSSRVHTQTPQHSQKNRRD